MDKKNLLLSNQLNFNNFYNNAKSNMNNKIFNSTKHIYSKNKDSNIVNINNYVFKYVYNKLRFKLRLSKNIPFLPNKVLENNYNLIFNNLSILIPSIPLELYNSDISDEISFVQNLIDEFQFFDRISKRKEFTYLITQISNLMDEDTISIQEMKDDVLFGDSINNIAHNNYDKKTIKKHNLNHKNLNTIGSKYTSNALIKTIKQKKTSDAKKINDKYFKHNNLYVKFIKKIRFSLIGGCKRIKSINILTKENYSSLQNISKNTHSNNFTNKRGKLLNFISNNCKFIVNNKSNNLCNVSYNYSTKNNFIKNFSFLEAYTNNKTKISKISYKVRYINNN